MRAYYVFFTLLLSLSLLFSCKPVIKEAQKGEISPDTTLLAQRPPMGWNSYNCFGGNVAEQEVRANADYMAENLKQYGWEYIVVDFLWYCDDQDSWEKFANRRPAQHIDEYGRLIPSEKLHPSSADGKGFKPLGDYIHSKGLKFGIHIMRGIPHQAIDSNTPVKNSTARASEIANITDTCLWYGGLTGVAMTNPGAQEYYNSLFELYAEWGVDYIKVDDIVFPYHADEIEAVQKAIKNCGRPIVLSLSPGPAFIGNPKHLRENANLWRISADFWDHWESLEKQLSLCRQWAPYVTEGHWPDADMLPLGKLNKRTELKDHPERLSFFTSDEKYFLMTLWSIFRSPLMFGGNLPENDPFTLSLITNEEIIRVNQFSKNNREISFTNGISIWTAEDKEKPLHYMAILNVNEEPQTLRIPLEKLGNPENPQIRDLWKKSNIEKTGKEYMVTIAPHGAALFSIRINK
jgi:hypothetical protein